MPNKKQPIDTIAGLISRLIDIQDIARKKRFPCWSDEERPQLITDEIENIINELQEDENLIIT